MPKLDKIDLSRVRLELTPTGTGSKVFVGDDDISFMVDHIDVSCDTSGGTVVQIRLPMVDCRVEGRGEILCPHPSSTELLEVAEVRFKNGQRWVASSEPSRK